MYNLYITLIGSTYTLRELNEARLVLVGHVLLYIFCPCDVLYFIENRMLACFFMEGVTILAVRVTLTIQVSLIRRDGVGYNDKYVIDGTSQCRALQYV